MILKTILFGLLISITSAAQYTDDYDNQGNIREIVGLKAGIITPIGSLTSIGCHPGLGLQYGYAFNKFLIGFDIDFRFLKSKNYYNFQYKDSVYNTNKLGSYFNLGLICGYQVLNFNNSKINLLLGLGGDQLKPIKSEKFIDGFKDDGLISSYNLNLGIEYLVKIYYSFDFGVFIKYNIVDYSLKNKTSLSGDYLSSGIILRL